MIRCEMGDDEKSSFEEPRRVLKVVLAECQLQDVGVTLMRTIGREGFQNLDPFILLDQFTVSEPAGFPDHPHRGFEAVTYMLQGSFRYQDAATGQKGTITAGDMQWMSAGRGIIHSEMPGGEGENIGLQLWINLPSSNKLMEPKYHEVKSKDMISVAQRDGVQVRVITGESFGKRSPFRTQTPTMFLDFTLAPGAKVEHLVPWGWNAFVYVVRGEGVFGDPETAPATGDCALVLGGGDGLRAWNRSSEPLRFLLVAGEPLGEPMVRHGPFVMSTQAEIEEAIWDYRSGRNGFESRSGEVGTETEGIVHVELKDTIAFFLKK